jgi:drug/metabolite transporter (DMT)-like permease
MLQGLLLSLALYYLPPSTVHTINSSSPIVVYVVDYLRNGTQVSQKQVFGILIGFLSIIITVNSNYIMHNLGY